MDQLHPIGTIMNDNDHDIGLLYTFHSCKTDHQGTVNCADYKCFYDITGMTFT
jgi:hypothetical protein